MIVNGCYQVIVRVKLEPGSIRSRWRHLGSLTHHPDTLRTPHPRSIFILQWCFTYIVSELLLKCNIYLYIYDFLLYFLPDYCSTKQKILQSVVAFFVTKWKYFFYSKHFYPVYVLLSIQSNIIYGIPKTNLIFFTCHVYETNYFGLNKVLNILIAFYLWTNRVISENTVTR